MEVRSRSGQIRSNFEVGCFDQNWGLFDSACHCKFNDTIFIFVSCLKLQKNEIENFASVVFEGFWTIGYQILMDFLKIWHVGSLHEVL